VSKELSCRLKISHNERRNNELLHKLSSIDASSLQLTRQKVEAKTRILAKEICYQ